MGIPHCGEESEAMVILVVSAGREAADGCLKLWGWRSSWSIHMGRIAVRLGDIIRKRHMHSSAAIDAIRALGFYFSKRKAHSKKASH